MKTKSNIILALLTGLTIAASSASANSVIIHDTAFDGIGGSNNQGARGGEFVTQTLDNGLLGLGSTFGTFCLENYINIKMERHYTYSIDARAYSGGTDLHDTAGNPAGDALSKGTVFLYAAFLNNTLPDHLSGGLGVGNYLTNHDRNAGLLQQAIWTLEDEYNYNKPAFDYGLGYNPYLNLVFSQFGVAGAYTNDTSNSGVQVLNLWDVDGKDVQSLLVYVRPDIDTHSVPDSGTTSVLAGLGLISLAAFRRRIAR